MRCASVTIFSNTRIERATPSKSLALGAESFGSLRKTLTCHPYWPPLFNLILTQKNYAVCVGYCFFKYAN